MAGISLILIHPVRISGTRRWSVDQFVGVAGAYAQGMPYFAIAVPPSFHRLARPLTDSHCGVLEYPTEGVGPEAGQEVFHQSAIDAGAWSNYPLRLLLPVIPHPRKGGPGRG